MKKFMCVVTIAMMVIVMAGAAAAATVTSGFNATATVISNCIISTAAGNLAFGNYDPTSASDLDAGPASVGFKCTRGTNYNTYIAGTRTFVNGGDTLTFNLYTDNTYATAYPSATVGVAGSAADNTEISVNYYGRIVAGQDVGASGVLTRALNFTVEF